MTDRVIRIATRKSPLALWQAGHVAMQLQRHHPKLTIELVKMSTRGDKILDAPLAKIGGKSLFVKELEQGILAGQADIAVHSMKDVPVEFPEGLHLSVIMAREDPYDALVSNAYQALAQLPKTARIGSSSLRRQCQIKQLFPDCQILPLRGNVNTRLAKLDAGEFDAIILAAVGLKRLGMADRISETIASTISLPAIGQGAIGIECRIDDLEINEILPPLNHLETSTCVAAERAMNARLQGGCQVPIAGFAQLQGDNLTMRGLVGSPDGQLLLRASHSGTAAQASTIGTTIADELLANGADQILSTLR